MKEKYRYLLGNIGLMTLSSFANKILTLLLVPLYTGVLSTEEYGVYDLYATTGFLLIPLLSVCVAEAVLRFSLDKGQSPKEVFSVSLGFYFRACAIVAVLVFLNHFFGLIEIFNRYPLFFFLYFSLCLASDILTQLARGLERLFDVAVAGIVSSACMLSMNILLLLVFPMGLEGYFIAQCSAFGATVIYLALRLKIWRYIGGIKRRRKLTRDMMTYSGPLVLNQIGWWVNNVSDRYVVTLLCGAAANGVYSVASKIPSLLMVFQTIFNQAWTLSAVKESEEGDGSFYVDIYRLYNCGLVILCSFLIVANKGIAAILFAKDFYLAWQYAPFLLISVVFSSLSHLLGGIFTAQKETGTIAKTTLTGAIINLLLNFVLVYFIGPLGAAVATLVSYFAVWLIRLLAVRRRVKFALPWVRDALSYGLLVAQAWLMLVGDSRIQLYLGELLLLAFCVFLYRKDLGNVVKGLWNKLRKH